MSQNNQPISRAITRARGLYCAAATMMVMGLPSAHADLPTPAAPRSGAVAEGDYLGYGNNLAADIVNIITVVLLAIAGIGAGFMLYRKAMDWKDNRADVGSVATTAAIGLGMFVGTAFIMNQVATFIDPLSAPGG